MKKDLELGLWVCIITALYFLTACSFKVEVGYHGETGVSDTTVSKEFVDTKQPVSARRY